MKQWTLVSYTGRTVPQAQRLSRSSEEVTLGDCGVPVERLEREPRGAAVRWSTSRFRGSRSAKCA